MQEDKLTIHPPLYLIGMKYSCWKCEADMPVVAILAPDVEGSGREVCVFSNICKLPKDVADHIQGRVPTFRLKYSKTVKQKYYANTCPKCGMLSGDFHLHSEHGAPFFPVGEKEAALLYMTEIPVAGTIHIEASPSIGRGEIILNNARRIS